jgi:chemotaxis protein MotB
VVGLADSNLLDRENPLNPLNRRISIIVLNKLAEERMSSAGGEIEAGSADSLEQSMEAPRDPTALPTSPVDAHAGAAP